MGFISLAEGLRMVADGQQQFLRSGLQVFLRLQNFPDVGDYNDVGVPYTPTGAAAAQAGFADILIDPPPAVKEVSMHNIGLLQALPGGRLYFGDKIFTVSHTFVLNMMQQYPGIKDPYDVWRNWDNQTPVVGLVYNDRLFEMLSVTHKELGGETVSWQIIAHGLERPLDPGAQEEEQP